MSSKCLFGDINLCDLVVTSKVSPNRGQRIILDASEGLNIFFKAKVFVLVIVPPCLLILILACGFSSLTVYIFVA